MSKTSRSPRLLVPITLEALVVNDSDVMDNRWSIQHHNFTGYTRLEPSQPDPFVSGNDRPRPGITLHWALPDALAHGRPAADGQIAFPKIPNRWLVARLASDPAYTRYWMVESDYLGDDGTNPYWHRPETAVAEPAVTLLGKKWPLEEWPAAREDEAAFLTAVGPGDLTFAAYVANIDNVLAFHDDLADVAAEKENEKHLVDPALHLTYMVAGWYARAADDPLAELGNLPPTAWRQQLKERFQWSLGDESDLDQALHEAAQQLQHPGASLSPADVRLPRQMLCHGLVYDVPWRGRGAPLTPDSKPPHLSDFGDPRRADVPHVAIGNALPDALATMVAYLLEMEGEGQDVAQMLQAVEHEMLDVYDEPGGQIALKQRLHQEWFIPEKGGTIWELVAPRRPVEANEAAETRLVTPPALTTAQEMLLDELNQQQAALDGTQRQLQDTRWNLYALWWKRERLPHFAGEIAGVRADERAAFAAELDRLFQEAAATAVSLTQTMARQQQQVAATRQQLESTLTGDDPMTLKASAAPRYWRPADPVILIYGGRRAKKHGMDGRYTADGTLFCRLTGQTMRHLTINGVAVSLPVDETPLSGKPIPPETADLLAESLLLDTTQAPAIADQCGEPPAQVRKRQQIIWSDVGPFNFDEQILAEVTGFAGVRPSPVAVNAWRQPWSPLFLSWQAKWYPGHTAPEAALEQWCFDPRNDNLEYERPPTYELDSGKAVTLKGRTLLAAAAPQALAANLESLATTLADRDIHLDDTARQALAQAIDRLRQADMLAHPLTGLHDYLIMRDRYQQHKPPPDTAVTVNGQRHLLNDLLGNVERLTPIPYRNGAQSSHFYPLRAGNLRLEKLWIIDGFGQVYDPIFARGQDAATFQPLRSSGLIPKKASDPTVQLPPRLLQPARLQFRFISAAGEAAQDAGLVHAANPVCGWLLPNHLDRALAVFDAAGVNLGAIMLVGSRQTRRLRWEPAPGPVRVARLQEIANPHLRRMVRALFNQSNNAAVFLNFLEAIDKTLWTADPLGQSNSQHLSVLVGRPLAVVRAQIGLELAGSPVTDQLWGFTGQQATKDFESADYQAQIGHILLRNDGTIGYFVEDDYQHFRTVHPDLDLLQPGQYVQYAGTLPLQLNQPCQLTLLLDSRGSIHGRSGLLPTKAITLPPRYSDEPLARMDVTFRVGPLLNELTGLQMPLPVTVQGSWSWIERTGVNLWAEEDVDAADQMARFSSRPVWLREGWLKLSEALGAAPDDSNAGQEGGDRHGTHHHE